jgi:predicted nucleic acid-binding protein
MSALSAADMGIDHGLALADAIVFATAHTKKAELITSDADFERLPGVTYLHKPTRRQKSKVADKTLVPAGP